MTEQEKTEFWIAAYDVSGIQDYIFATNRLRENGGASLIVSRILKDCLPQAMKQVEQQNPGKKMVIDWKKNKERFLESKDGAVFGEIIYIGGGNALAAFLDEETYFQVGRKFAKEVLKLTTSLTIVSSICSTKGKTFQEVRSQLLQELGRKKSRLVRQRTGSSFPIVEQDSYFGMPVIAQEHGTLLTREQVEKRRAYAAWEETSGWLNEENTLHEEPLEGIPYAVEMEDLVLQRGEDSTVAVIHIDGNGMGDYIKKQIETMGTDYKESISTMRKTSEQIAERYQSVFSKICRRLWDGQKPILALRPILIDGDDVTFLCSARMALPAAAAFLRLLMIEGREQKLTACAGIAFVHSHYPFRLAYEMAEECCANAKKSWYASTGKEQKAFLDFELVRGACQKDLKQKRRERFSAGLKPEEVLNRPYCVTENSCLSDCRSFDFLWDITGQLVKGRDLEGKAKWPASRLKKLYEAYLKGREDVEAWSQECASRGYDFLDLVQNRNQSLFDALECMDFYDYRWTGLINHSEQEETL